MNPIVYEFELEDKVLWLRFKYIHLFTRNIQKYNYNKNKNYKIFI